MIHLRLADPGKRLSVLCLGAHCDDIEIGVGGTLLAWIAQGIDLNITWCVLSSTPDRAKEAHDSARDFLKGVGDARVEVLEFKNSFFPSEHSKIKAWFEALAGRVNPDVILTHRRDDAHQDHQEVSAHTWHTFRNHLILEYEIPKWDGDMGRPNVYVPLPHTILERKIALLMAHFGSQRSKDWYDEQVFRGLARLRGMECRAADRYAEGFFVNKLIVS